MQSRSRSDVRRSWPGTAVCNCRPCSQPFSVSFCSDAHAARARASAMTCHVSDSEATIVVGLPANESSRITVTDSTRLDLFRDVTTCGPRFRIICSISEEPRCHWTRAARAAAVACETRRSITAQTTRCEDEVDQARSTASHSLSAQDRDNCGAGRVAERTIHERTP